MGNYEELKQAVSNVIKSNGNQEITGAILQNALLTIISTIGADATFAGIATPTTNPGTPDQNVFWIAFQSGIYSNFNGIELESRGGIFSNKNGQWEFTSFGIGFLAATDIMINNTNTYATVLDVPVNRVFAISNVLTSDFGLPQQGYGVLFSFCPYSEPILQGYKVILYAIGNKLFYALTSNSTTKDNIVWVEIANKGDITKLETDLNKSFKPTDQSLNIYDDVFQVPVNKTYQTTPDTPSGFGLPIEGEYGTFMSISPYSNNNFNGYRMMIWYNVSRLFYALTSNSTTKDNIVWVEIANKGDITKLETDLNKSFKPTDQSLNIYDDVFQVPVNKTYQTTPDTPSGFGLPIEGEYGTFMSISPYSNNNFNGYRMMIWYNVSRLFYALTSNSTTKDNIVWNEAARKSQLNIIENIGLQQLRIVFIGDSIVEGYGCTGYNGGANGTSGHLIPNNVKTWYRNTSPNCWSNMMINYLTENYNNVIAANNGIGGFTTQQILDNLETLTKTDDGEFANYVILSIGTNNKWSGNKLSVITVPLKQIISWCKSKGMNIIVLTNTPYRESGEKPNNGETVQSAIIRACADFEFKPINMFARFNYYLWGKGLTITEVTNDNLHPNDLGYEIMYNIIREQLML